MITVLAALSASAAAGMRIALPLLTIGLLQGDLWSGVPLLSRIYPPVIFGILTSWSLVELFGTKNLLGLRLIQLVQLVCSPIVGVIMSIGMITGTETPTWVIGFIGGALAFVLQLVHVGWFYHLGRLPLWAIFVQDALSFALAFLAINSPQIGGLIALALLAVYIPYSVRVFRSQGI